MDNHWTEPYDFDAMKDQNPALYAKLAEATLVIIKGDLNYRKLMGDINWPPTTSFAEALRRFKPTVILSLRTVKCDTISGLPEGKAEALKQQDVNWMRTGQFGLIQSNIDQIESCQCPRSS